METRAMTSDAEGTGRRREERWRLLLLAALILGGLALFFNVGGKAPLKGKVDPASHVEAKRGQESSRQRVELDRRFKEGVAMLHARQYEYALTAFHRVLQLAPDMPEAHANMGFALLGLGKPKAAKDFFDAATNLRPHQLNAYFGLAEALEQLGDEFSAMQAMETYVHLSPENDPFRRKAQSAAWELRAKLEEKKVRAETEAVRKSRANPQAGKP